MFMQPSETLCNHDARAEGATKGGLHFDPFSPLSMLSNGCILVARGLRQTKQPLALQGVAGYWRRDRDSNPGYGFPYTRFPSVPVRPLRHLSFFFIRRLVEIRELIPYIPLQTNLPHYSASLTIAIPNISRCPLPFSSHRAHLQNRKSRIHQTLRPGRRSCCRISNLRRTSFIDRLHAGAGLDQLGLLLRQLRLPFHLHLRVRRRRP